ncbi:MAG: cysteine desulfurase family protein [Bacilli bacterium]|jgi:cysteine desulfurase|nr:cysteine desulfurase family protein [Bacilli bacterium]
MIYFDNASTTLVDPEILKTYIDLTKKHYANPASSHIFGQETNRILELARRQILTSLQLENCDLVFTSGATESNNLAIKGYALRNKANGKHLIVSKIEHPSVLETVRELEREYGFNVSYLNIDENGNIDLDELKQTIRSDTILVSIMAVNNEIGVVNPIEKIADIIVNYKKIAFHVDAVQALGKVKIDYSNVDMITISAHKINGLKSCGVLIKKKNIKLTSLNHGGEQENGLRSGTNDVAMAGAFAKTIRLSLDNFKERNEHVKTLADKLKDWLLVNSQVVILNSHSTENPYIVNFSLKNKKASVVVEALSKRDIMVSSVSACSSRHEPISHVLEAMSHDEQRAKNTIRVSFSHLNTLEEVESFISTLTEILGEIR